MTVACVASPWRKALLSCLIPPRDQQPVIIPSKIMAPVNKTNAVANHDQEKGGIFAASDSVSGNQEHSGNIVKAPKGPWMRSFVDSFKRDPNATITESSGRDGSGFDAVAAAEATANTGLAKALKARHLQMIAIGGSIGKFLLCFQQTKESNTSQELVSSWALAKPSPTEVPRP